MRVRTGTFILLLGIAGVYQSASAGPAEEQRQFELELLGHCRHVRDTYESLTSKELSKTDAKWQQTLQQALVSADDVRVTQPNVLTEKYGRGTILAATFDLGKGHVVPQTFRHKGNLAGAMATQRLMLHFIAQALRPAD